MATTEVGDLEREFEEATAARDASRAEPGKIPDKNPRYTWIRFVDAYRNIREGQSWRKYLEDLKNCHPHDGGGCLAVFSSQVSKKLREDRDFVYCITTNTTGRPHLAFSWEDETHCRLASTVYKKLMDKAPDARVEAAGPHWQEIGFQGTNFTTDAGRLGAVFVLLQMLAFINTAPKLAMQTFTESRPPTMRPFSWALWSMCVSTRVIDAYDRKKLNKHINREGNVMKVLNSFYIGIFSELYDRWCAKEQRDEMHDFNTLKKDITHWSLTNTDAVFKKAKLAMLESKDTAPPVTTDGGGGPSFTHFE